MIDVHVRGIDPQVWRELRIEALEQDSSVARIIEQLWRAGHPSTPEMVNDTYGPREMRRKMAREWPRHPVTVRNADL